MNKIKNILIVGPQGSGKDTQSEMLSKKREIPFIATGDLFRKEIREKTEIGSEITELYNQGKLAPDTMTLELLKKRLSDDDIKNGYILNGYPRNIKQVKSLEEITKIDLVFEINISDEEGIHRLSGRRVCSVCGATFHVKYNPPKEKDICDHCGEKLMTRDDDKEEAIKKRLAIYHEETEPILDYYQEKGMYNKINGEQSIDDVFKEIEKKLTKIEL